MSRPPKKHKPLDPLLEAFIRALARDQAERDIRRIYGTREEFSPLREAWFPHRSTNKRGAS